MSDTTDQGSRSMVRPTVLGLAALLLVWALVVALTDGIDLRPLGLPFRSTDARRPFVAALLVLAGYAVVRRAEAAAGLESFSRLAASLAAATGRHRAPLALGLSIVAVALGMRFGIHVAGGSDSFGYVSQAPLWLAGDLVTGQPIATEVPWPEADWTFAPLGYRPAVEPGAIVPVYAPGLSILMALGSLIAGACGVYSIVPLLGGWLVWLTYRLGTRMWSPLVGLFSAALVASSPTFLFMLMNPMSDVPVSAFFLCALVLALAPGGARAFWIGAAVSVAILIRPNLVPVGAVFLAFVLVRAAGRPWRAAGAFAAGGLPLILLVAWVNTHLYGAPWRSGYGSLDEFYAWWHALRNLVQYPEWLLRTETPFIVLLLVPLVAVRGLGERRRALTFAVAFAASIWLCYLFYAPFDAWWYLRFLLPAFPPMLVMAAMGLAWLLRRIADRRKALAAGLVITAALFAVRVNTIRQEGLLSLAQGGVVYLSAADYVRTRLPPNALLLTVQHSGSIRHYADRLTLRWDLLGPEWWPRVFDILVERGYRPYLLVSSFEEAQLRMHFGLADRPDAPGTVVAQMTRPEAIRIYDPLRATTGPPESIAAVAPCLCGPEPEPADGF